MYSIIRRILFMFDAEKVHHFSMHALQMLCSISLIKKIITKIYCPPNDITKAFGLTFKNKVGLAAGFDKNAKYLNELEALGFGFVEIGTVTPVAQDGNPKPRLFRLPKDKALINRMGFNNEGVQAEVERLKAWELAVGSGQWAVGSGQLAVGSSLLAVGCGELAVGGGELAVGSSQWAVGNSELAVGSSELAVGSLQLAVGGGELGADNSIINPALNKQTTLNGQMVIGGNIGKNKITPNEDAWKDYEICFKALHPYVHYFVVNVSSPNTPGLRELQEKAPLKKILTHLQTINATYPKPKPILLKIAPDLTLTQVDEVLQLATEIQLDGLVIANTSIDKSKLSTNSNVVNNLGAGGISGLPLQHKTTALVEYINNKTNNTIPIIASGGIFTGVDAKEKLTAGACLVQVWTGFVYEGPAIVKKISRYLAGNSIQSGHT